MNELSVELVSCFRVPEAGCPIGNLKAFIQVKVGDITICDCRVIQQPGQKAYISGPQKQANGQWVPLVKMTSTLRAHVEAVILPQLRAQGVVT